MTQTLVEPPRARARPAHGKKCDVADAPLEAGEPVAEKEEASSASGPTLFTITPLAYQQMAEAGHFQDRRVELLRGRIIEMPAMGPEHITATRLLNYALNEHFQRTDGFIVSVPVPLQLSDSEPEPDGFVYRGSIHDRPSDAEHVVLVVEVSKTSIGYDRTTKLALYAEAGYGDYWIVNLVDRVLEVYRNPMQSNGEWTYADKTTIAADGTVSPLAKPEATLKVADLLPRE